MVIAPSITLQPRETSRGADLESTKYVTIYKKNNDTWKIYRTIYNTNSLSTCASVQVGPAPSEEATKPNKS